MLHAIEKKKTTIYRRYLGHRDGVERRVFEEDEITSTVLGPLAFFEPGPVLGFWRRLLAREAPRAAVPPGDPSRMEFALWPRRRDVEPDGYLRFTWADGTRLNLLIEVKWHAPLSGDDQLVKQWREFLDASERAATLHLFIAPEVSVGLAARNDASPATWQAGGEDRLILVSWRQICAALQHWQPDGPIARWAELTHGYLRAVGIKPFRGFDFARTALPTLPIVHRRFFLGLTHGFSGFARAAAALPQSQAGFRPFFKTGE